MRLIRFINLVHESEQAYLRDPSRQRLLGALNRCREMRGIVTTEHVWFWPASGMIHKDGWKYLLGQGELTDQDGVAFAFASNHPGCEADFVWSGQLADFEGGPPFLALSSTEANFVDPRSFQNPVWQRLLSPPEGLGEA